MTASNNDNTGKPIGKTMTPILQDFRHLRHLINHDLDALRKFNDRFGWSDMRPNRRSGLRMKEHVPAPLHMYSRLTEWIIDLDKDRGHRGVHYVKHTIECPDGRRPVLSQVLPRVIVDATDDTGAAHHHICAADTDGHWFPRLGPVGNVGTDFTTETVLVHGFRGRTFRLSVDEAITLTRDLVGICNRIRLDPTHPGFPARRNIDLVAVLEFAAVLRGAAYSLRYVLAA